MACGGDKGVGAERADGCAMPLDVPMRPFAVIAVAVAAASCLVRPATADLVSIASNAPASAEGLGAFVGSLQWDYLGGSSGSLTVSLTNTSAPANGGYITSFLFRTAQDPALSGSLVTSSDADFLDIGFGEAAPPFSGIWSGGAGLGGTFLGGGSPVPGLGVGSSGTFVFAITSSAASTLSASSFLGTTYDFVVRFRGFNNGGSDKTPGQLVPAPGAAIVLLGAAARGRRRRDA